MTNPFARIAAALFAVLAVGAADAAVYRCGSHYADQPCPDGQALSLLDTTPSAADAARARAAVDRDQRRADAMERQRLYAQANERPAAATSLGPAKPPPAPPAHPPKRKAKGKIRVVDGDDFSARAPTAPKQTPRPASDAPLPRVRATPR